MTKLIAGKGPMLVDTLLTDLAKKYCIRDDAVPPVDLLSSGEVLCNTIKIQKPQDAAFYRIRYGEEINYIGFPGENGSGHYLNSRFPLAIRSTATKEEKELACAFLGMLLSYECQTKMADEVNFYLSIRSDVLDNQLHSVNEKTQTVVSGFDPMMLGDHVDNEKDAETLYRLINSAKPYKTFPKELNAVIVEELQEYFAGTITEDILIEHLENRVQLYLDERK